MLLISLMLVWRFCVAASSVNGQAELSGQKLETRGFKIIGVVNDLL